MNLIDIGVSLALLQNAASEASEAADAATEAAQNANSKASAANDAATAANAAAAACSAYTDELTTNRVALNFVSTTSQAEMRDVEKRLQTAESQLAALT